MKLADAKIIIITADKFPLYSKEQANKEVLWQHRWHQHFKNSILIEAPGTQGDDNKTNKHLYLKCVSNIKMTIEQSDEPIIIIAHSFAVSATLLAISDLSALANKKIKGAFFVSPIIFDVEDEPSPFDCGKLPFPNFLIASNNDPFLEQEKAKELAFELGSFFIDAGANGHINEATEHGPWPEGLLLFSQFMSKL